MKKTILFIAMLLPSISWGSLGSSQMQLPNMGPFDGLISFSETRTMEWGCPVSDRITATNREEALQKVSKECLEEVQRAASLKPGVLDVIQTKVIWPDVHIMELADGFELNGTFFLETTVVHRAEMGGRYGR